MDAVETVNSMPAEQLEQDLLACCAAPAWGKEILKNRPYRDKKDILHAAGVASEDLGWDDVLAGLAAHPRIGERAAGDSADAKWSRQEQAAAARSADERTKNELIEANHAYEKRFGHVFLIFASGRSQAEILDAARQRLGNDDVTERAVVTGELRKIALLRLERVLDAL
jgi:2-oxo-4-hydroxy-4-carboxy-5-ureidoimidazoline decarboxylase